MAENNIFVRITGESNMDSVSKKLAESNEVLVELEENMRVLNKTEEAINEHIKKTAASTEQMNKKLKENAKKYAERRKAMEADIEAQKHDIAVMEANAKAATLLQGGQKSVTQQLRQMREAMLEMEEAGLENLDAYEALAIKSAQLSDAQGDLQQRIRILASDTMQLDGAMSAGSGLAGAFNTATSAAELLGGETEGLQKAFYKVQATLSILNGVQEVANALNKDSAFRVVASANAKKIFVDATKLETAAQAKANLYAEKAAAATGRQAVAYKALSVSTGLATKAMKLLRVALAASVIGLVVVAIAGLVAYFDQMNDQLGQSFEGWDKFKQAAMGALEVVKGTLANIGEGIVKLFERDWSGAWEAFKKTADVSSKYAAGVAKEAAAQAAKVTDELYQLAQARNQRAQAQYAKSLEDSLRIINKAYLAAKTANTERHASEVDMAKSELEFAKQRAAVTEEQNTKAIAANQREEAAAKAFMNAKYKALAAEKKGTEQYLEALNAYNDAQSNYYSVVQKTTDLRQAIDDANQEAIDAGIAYKQAVEGQQRELVNARIAIMREGADKEIQQVEANYDEQLKSLQGEGEQEVALRRAIEERKAMEIQQIRDRYDKQAEQSELNHQIAMQQIEMQTAMSPSKKIEAYEAMYTKQQALYKSQEEWLQKEFASGTISQQEFNDGVLEITRNRIQAEIDLEQNKLQVVGEAFQTTLGYMQQISDMMFEAMSIGIQEELDNLDKYYTTDAEEAAKNADKKYISEKEYEKRKAALEMKQAKMAKAQALTNIGISTAMAIMQTLAQMGATPWGLAMAAVAGVMGAAQFAVAAAKPLAQYEKGRNGGKGEYAIVGEKGAELMYVPDGASIVPHNKLNDPSQWGAYGVPSMTIPDLPSMPSDSLDASLMLRSMEIDYDRLGRAVAANIPQQKAVTVNVDKSGITVTNGRDTRTYLDTKYLGAWK